jgi:hypothetical protein
LDFCFVNVASLFREKGDTEPTKDHLKLTPGRLHLSHTKGANPAVIGPPLGGRYVLKSEKPVSR